MYTLQPVKFEFQLLGFHSIDYFEFGKNFSHNPEKHDFWEMVYVDKGSIVSISNGAGYNMSQGQVVFHEPGEVHAHVSDQKAANNMLVITFSVVGEPMKRLSKKYFTLDKTGKMLLSLFTEEFKSAMGSNPSNYHERKELNMQNFPFGATQMMHCYLSELLLHLIRKSDTAGTKIRANEESRLLATNSIVSQIIAFMSNNVNTPLNLAAICQEFMIGKSQLTKQFHECTGQSPIQYFNYLKIKEAKKMLRDGTYSVTKISELLGYQNIHVFSRAFKKETGYSPLGYQKSIFSKEKIP